MELARPPASGLVGKRARSTADELIGVQERILEMMQSPAGMESDLEVIMARLNNLTLNFLHLAGRVVEESKTGEPVQIGFPYEEKLSTLRTPEGDNFRSSVAMVGQALLKTSELDENGMWAGMLLADLMVATLYELRAVLDIVSGFCSCRTVESNLEFLKTHSPITTNGTLNAHKMHEFLEGLGQVLENQMVYDDYEEHEIEDGYDEDPEGRNQEFAVRGVRMFSDRADRRKRHEYELGILQRERTKLRAMRQEEQLLALRQEEEVLALQQHQARFCGDYCHQGETRRSCFKRNAKHMHPDKGGDRERYTAFNNLWERIPDEDRDGSC